MPTKPKSHSQRLAAANPAAHGRRVSDRASTLNRRLDPVQAAVDRLRSSWRWRCVSRQKLRLQPLCEPCLARGETTLACDVNHVVPVRTHVERGTPDEAFRLDGLQSCCRSCHNVATAKETAERRERRNGRVNDW